MSIASGGVRIGIAVDAASVTAVLRAGADVHVSSVPLAAATTAGTGHGEAGDVAMLREAFVTLHAQLEAAAGRPLGRVRAALALLPPHGEARLVALPPLRRGEAEAVLRRDAARHFIGTPGPRLLAVRMPHPLARRQADAAPVLATSASAAFVEAVRAAAAGVNWHIARHTAAHAAWLAAAERTAGRAAAGTPFAVAAVVEGTAHLLRVDRGAVTVLRRVPAAETAEAAAALGSGPGSVSVFADDATAHGRAAAFTAAGWTVARGPAGARAAADAASDSALELVPVGVAAERERRFRRTALQLAGLAAVLLAGAAGVHAWGLQRELAAVRAQRADLRERVRPLMDARDSVDRLHTRAADLAALGQGPQWTRALFDVALLLPADARVVSLHGTGDTLVVSAEGARAGAALQALRTAESLRTVQLRGSVQRDLEAGATAMERFTLDARLNTRAPVSRGGSQ